MGMLKYVVTQSVKHCQRCRVMIFQNQRKHEKLNILQTELNDNRTDCPSATLRSDNDPYTWVVCVSLSAKNQIFNLKHVYIGGQWGKLLI